MKKKKIIVILRGGLGNQLFTYAFAKSLAIKNNFELVLNYKSGFKYDLKYKRKYLLNFFNHTARLASNNEMLMPFHRLRRTLIIKLNNYFPSIMPFYLLQKDVAYDQNLINIKLNRTTIIDGCWISEEYFKDINLIIQNEFEINFELPRTLLPLNLSIKQSNSVAIHIRWFNKVDENETHNLTSNYYKNAIEEMSKKVSNPYFFIFTDEPEFVNKKINLNEFNFTLINNKLFNNNELIDFILMKSCKYFIIANSTFSWWAAWLSDFEDKIVITPDVKMDGLTTWGTELLVPDSWIKLKS